MHPRDLIGTGDNMQLCLGRACGAHYPIYDTAYEPQDIKGPSPPSSYLSIQHSVPITPVLLTASAPAAVFSNLLIPLQHRILPLIMRLSASLILFAAIVTGVSAAPYGGIESRYATSSDNPYKPEESSTENSHLYDQARHVAYIRDDTPAAVLHSRALGLPQPDPVLGVFNRLEAGGGEPREGLREYTPPPSPQPPAAPPSTPNPPQPLDLYRPL
ncbi:hypothetical protein BC835DRAFT_1347569 [Cytidiella melzeri]|nr:hypothetical protein BC835DRAFT_1347569 [Cytidiella melzeri]